MDSGIYEITNIVNHKFYIGSAVNIHQRWLLHTSNLNCQTHANKHLQAAWNLYEAKSFSFEVIEFCPKEVLLEREQFYLEVYHAVEFGYNALPTAGSNFGKKVSEETLQKMSLAKIGKTGRKQSEEAKCKIAASRLGKHLTDETKLKLSLMRKGKKTGRTMSDEDKKWRSLRMKGKKIQSDEDHKKFAGQKRGIPRTEEVKKRMKEGRDRYLISIGKTPSTKPKLKIPKDPNNRKLTDETKAKISASRKGHPVSDETREKISQSQKGKPESEETKVKRRLRKVRVSDETRKKMSDAHKGRTFSETTRKKMSDAKKKKNLPITENKDRL